MSACANKPGIRLEVRHKYAFRRKLSVLTLRETFLVLVFKNKNSVSKYVSELRSLKGRKKLLGTETGRHSTFLVQDAESVADFCLASAHVFCYLVFSFCLKAPIP